MKKMKLFSSLMLNVFGGGLLSFALGGGVLVAFLFAFVMSFVSGAPSGALGMGLQKEIWMSTIVEGLFADNSFLSKAFNADEFVVQGKTVHIPNSGAASSATKNRVVFPAVAAKRTDNDLTFDLDEITTTPIHIPNAETIELSYNKRESAIRTDRASIIEVASESILYSWLPLIANSIGTSGAAVLGHTPAAAGNRKAFVKADVLALMTKFNNANVPQDGRYLLCDAVMYSQLIDSLTANEAQAFHSTVDVKNGVLGQLYSFNVMMRSRVGVYATAGTKKEWSAAAVATDNAASIAFHTNSVCRALGQVEMFGSESDPLYYGDIYSFLVRCGGRIMRNDVAGLCAVVQTATA